MKLIPACNESKSNKTKQARRQLNIANGSCADADNDSVQKLQKDQSTKRNVSPGHIHDLESGSDTDDEWFDQYKAEVGQTKKDNNGKKSTNSEHNSTLVQLVRHLETKETKERYSAKHLTLWATKIVDGELSGVHEEPN